MGNAHGGNGVEPPPRPMECIECGAPRPMNGRWRAPLPPEWYPEPLTCSKMCRWLGGHPKGPFDG